MKEWNETEMDFLGLQAVVPDLKETFGELLYAGAGESVSWSIDGERMEGRFYSLISSVLRGQNVEILLLGESKVKEIVFGMPIRLVNPIIRAQNHKTESGGCCRLLLMAEDIKPLV